MSGLNRSIGSRIHHVGCLSCILLAILIGSSDSTAASSFDGWSVADVEVSGMPGGVAGGTAAGLALSAPAGFLGGAEAVISPALLAQDHARLLLLLARNGYPYAVVTHRFESRGDRRAKVIFEITPGLPVLIGNVSLSGSPAERPGLIGLARGMISPGDVFRDEVVASVVKAATLEVARAGYAAPLVEVAVAFVDSFYADVSFTVRAGERSVIASVSIVGVPQDLEGLALKSMDVKTGVMFSPDLVPRAQDNLRELQLFRQIKVGIERVGPGELEMHADLAPGAFRSANVSVGSWSDDTVRIQAGWKHRNIFHQGRGLGFRGSYSRHLREVGADAWWPALLGPRSLTNFGVIYHHEDEDSYDLENFIIEVATLLKPANRVTLRFSAAVEDVTVIVRDESRDQFEGTQGRQLVFGARLNRDRSDNMLYPSRGTRLTLEGAISPPGFMSEAPFVSVEATGVVYVPLPGDLVLASRVAMGSARALGDATDLLPNRRFFAGGVTSMRGAKRRRLGPTDNVGDPVGGEARWLAATELRIPLAGFLEAAVFIDAGQVWSDAGDWSFDGLATAAGGGLVIHTPVGPVRLDMARMITEPHAGEPRTVIHLAIGHPF